MTTDINKAKANETADNNVRPEDLYVITENGEQCFMWRSSQLTYIAQDRHELPQVLAKRFGHRATRLDLSYNSLTSFKNINKFTTLFELILDNNNLEDEHLKFALNLRLKTLSLNKNKLKNLYTLISSIKICFPNLEYLSLIGNPLCPGPFSGSRCFGYVQVEPAAVKEASIGIDELILSGQDFSTCSGSSLSDFNHQKYRHFIIYHLPNLRFLDSIKITPKERDEALRRCFYLNQLTHDSQSHDEMKDESRIRQMRCRNRSKDETTTGTDDGQPFRLTIMSAARTPHPEQPTGVFSKLAHRYTGKNSEGNRFIRNQDL